MIVQGDIVIDLCSLNNVDLHVPEESTGRVKLGSLKFASFKGKGKKRGETEAFGLELGSGEASVGSSNGMNKKGNGCSRKSSSEEKESSYGVGRGGEELPLSISRSGSSASSSNPSNGKRGSNGDTLSDETGGTSGPSILSELSNSGGKGKARADFTGLPVTNGNGYGMNEEMLSEGTRNWLAEQSNRPQVPSWATSYQPRRNFANSISAQLPNGSLSTSPSSMPSNMSISSSGFSFNPATMAPSLSSNSSSSLSSSGFVFNPAALASRSTLAGSIIAPSSISTSAPVRVPITTSASIPFTSSFTTAFPLASTTIPPSIPFSTLSSSSSSFSHTNYPLASSSSSSSTTPSSNAGSSTSNSTSSLNSSPPPHALVTICAGAKSHEIDAVTGTMNYYCPQAAYPVGCVRYY